MLTCMAKAFKLIEEHKGETIDLANIEQEDSATYAMIRKADTLGTFQIESRAQMAMLPRLKPRTFYDLVIQVAIVRPGPIQGDMVHPYLRRREGKEPVVYPFKVENGWFNGDADIISYDKEELFGTKLRALLQRRKNRDLFDLHEGFRELSLDPARLVAAFEHYLSLEENVITRANAEQRMIEKLTRSLTEDIAPLLSPGVEFSEDDAISAFGLIWKDVLPMLKGEPWKSSGNAIEQLREKRFPNLLR
ncbi:nucleotidyl transferase AbiEii/AbiGii toxin family protein [Rhizobium leguminosarum]